MIGTKKSGNKIPPFVFAYIVFCTAIVTFLFFFYAFRLMYESSVYIFFNSRLISSDYLVYVASM